MTFKRNNKQQNTFSQITIGLASPDSILDKSFGEVLKPETINYRSYKPERDGLFCERIFGPTKDYECYCGKYKRIRYKGIVCDRCGVEVTEKKVRRERMGHIKLVVPVVHIWYFKSLPNKIGYLLGMSSKKLESIVYYEKYCVVNPGIKSEDGIAIYDLLSEEEYLSILENLPRENQLLSDDDPNKFIARMGGEAVRDLLSRLDLDSLSNELRFAAHNETSQQKKSEALKRLKVVEAFREGMEIQENRPEWMCIQYLPVIPPELRPLVPLDGGRFASSDLNDLYRRVIIRNNRLKRLMEIKAPEVILRNEKRMLQESIDSLFDNSRKSNAVKAEGGRALKSLSDVLKGKQGRFRQNLLGKRVDYSGRSVIVVGPELRLHECGIPKGMAAELYKPFIIRKLIERGIVKTVKSAKKLVDKKEAVVWDILENVLKGHPVLLNRAPTLHRLSIQAFQPKLVEGKAIQLHPLVCTAFNADFDGDQMAVHVPLSKAAILEASLLMLSAHNILNPQDGSPITLPSQDMVLGLYYISKARKSDGKDKVKGEGRVYYSAEEVLIAYNEGKADLHAVIKCRVKVEEKGELVYKVIETTIGRVIFNQFVPEEVGYINEVLTKKNLKQIIGLIHRKTNVPTTVNFLDRIKELGFRMAFKGGLSFNLPDVILEAGKADFLKKAQAEVEEITENYEQGLITNNERYNQVIDIWTRADNKVTDALMKKLSSDRQGFNSVFMMLDSGARGSKQQIKQLGGLRGLMAKPRKSTGQTQGGEIIENPILANFVEGLTVLDYFISTHGARKGLADTALKTADAGYLTRRLVDVVHDVVIRDEDCGTLRGIPTSALKEDETVIEALSDRIIGRSSLHDIYTLDGKNLIVSSGEIISLEKAQTIEKEGIDEVEIRSVLTCETRNGVCVKCYGKNLATGRIAEMGDAVGVIAAQSIGEPGTQLTLRTFHTGGTASHQAGSNQLISKFEAVIEFDNVKTVNTLDDLDNKVTKVISRLGEVRFLDSEDGRILATQHIPYASTLMKKSGDKVKRGDVICQWDPYNAVILSEFAGSVIYDNVIDGVTCREEMDEQTGHREKVIIESRDKKRVPEIRIVDKKGETLKTYSLPLGAHIVADDNEEIKAGKVLVKIPRSLGKLSDITGGLPRVTELFEARNPSNPAVVSEIDGVVTFGKIKRGNREITITSRDNEEKKYMIPLSKHVFIQDGDFVKAGEPLSDGTVTPDDILRIKGPFAVQSYIVNEIQGVYRLQGVRINDKHIETIVRQMMRKVTIVDGGDTRFLEEEDVDKNDFIEENDRIYGMKFVMDAGDSSKFQQGQLITLRQLREENGNLTRADKKTVEVRDAWPATSAPLLLGITRASLGTKSWISAASFQETTKVLSQASIMSKVDTLEGLKENVISGKLIPAGTGLPEFQKLNVGTQDELARAEALIKEENY